MKSFMVSDEVFCMILDYCGGTQTDELFRRLSKWNSNFRINLLDNSSPTNKSKFITHQNDINSGVGGGIKDCIKLAMDDNKKYLMFITNDIVPITKIDFLHLIHIMKHNPDVVQVSASLTKNSDKKYYPWMINVGNKDNRIVRHADLLCCLLDLSFLQSFGGFPESNSGWGYDWEIGYQARLKKKKIVICDQYKIKHVEKTNSDSHHMRQQKMMELKEVYNMRYGDYRILSPFF
ncbi:MAG: hypothetical protein WBG90_13155 [Saonia sp.]